MLLLKQIIINTLGLNYLIGDSYIVLQHDIKIQYLSYVFLLSIISWFLYYIERSINVFYLIKYRHIETYMGFNSANKSSSVHSAHYTNQHSCLAYGYVYILYP